MLKVTPVRALRDNYIWLIHGRDNPQRVAVVDPGEAAPVITTLQRENLEPAAILITHHHWDHTNGITGLLAYREVPVHASASESLDAPHRPVRGGQTLRLPDPGLEFEVIDIPGHTAGHIAFHGHGALFCGDTLFSAGCGRVFEGTPAQMHESLGKLAALPGATKVYCGHEYTCRNLAFAAAVEPGNAAIADYLARAEARVARGEPTLPSDMEREHQVNVFLRTGQENVRQAVEQRTGRSLETEVDVFAALRTWKDEF